MKKNQTSSKAKQPKNIGYRVIMAILALCVPVITYFSEMVYMVWDSEVFKFIAQLRGNTADNGQTEQALSVRYFVEELLPMMKNGEGGSMDTVLQALEPIRAELICCLVFLTLAVVLAIVIFFVSAFSKNRIVGTSLAGVGLLSMIGLAISFHYLAVPILAGKVSLLPNFIQNPLLSSLSSSVMKLSIFQLSTGFYLMLFLFIAMVLWGLANWLVTIGENKSKKSA